MSPLTCADTGIIYQNPKPHVHSIHAYFPSVATLADGTMLATAALGEAFESADLHSHLFRSTDAGKTWTHEGPLYAPPTDRITSDCCRITAMPNGELVIFMVRHDRTNYRDEGLTNPKTLGFVPTELLLLRSSDQGRTWTSPAPLNPAIVGPAFELCSPITPISDGRWLLPTSTWPDWSGYCPNGTRMVALESTDQGRSWPVYRNVMADDQPNSRVFFWESKIVEMKDRRLLSIAWVYDDVAAKDRPNHYALSADAGRTWSKPMSMGLQGQTMAPMVLNDGRILTVYRRIDQPGLWANIARIDGDRWINESEHPLWGQQTQGLTSTTQNMSHNFNVLRFGAPCLTTCNDGSIFVAFWAYESCISVIRWFKLTIS